MKESASEIFFSFVESVEKSYVDEKGKHVTLIFTVYGQTIQVKKSAKYTGSYFPEVSTCYVCREEFGRSFYEHINWNFFGNPEHRVKAVSEKSKPKEQETKILPGFGQKRNRQCFRNPPSTGGRY